jgi:abortive infection bacteriophage resistance protein
MALEPVRIPYNKPCLTSEQHVTLLRERGLVIDDEARALRYLNFIGYYRLMVYGRIYQPNARNGDHTFAPGTTFDQILKLYIFDRKLRVTVIDALERIEVALKAVISNEMSTAHGPHWYAKKTNFQHAFNHRDFMKRVRERIGVGKPLSNQRPFISHYFSKYDKPPLPPSWMIFEVLSFGDVSYAFQNLHKQDQVRISQHFELPPKVLVSWIRSLSNLRNICAHHEVLWNRKFLVNQPIVSKKLKNLIPDNTRVYSYLVIIKYLLGKISETKKWAKQIKHLVENEGPHLRHANVAEVMGFPEDWHQIDLWGLP